MIKSVMIVLTLAVCLQGCVTYAAGERLEPGVIARIRRNITTRSEVEALVGPPMKVEIVAVGQRMLHYWYREVYSNENPFAPDTQVRHQQLLVWIGDSNKVLDFEFTDYLTDRHFEGAALVVKRAAVTTQPSEKPVWFSGGGDDSAE